MQALYRGFQRRSAHVVLAAPAPGGGGGGGAPRSAAAAAASGQAPTVASAAPAAKRITAAELMEEVERLRVENETLRQQLAGLKGGEAEAGAAAPTTPAAPTEEAADVAGSEGLAERLEAGIQWPKPEEGSFWERPPRVAPLPLAPPAAGPGGGVLDPRSFHIMHITGAQQPQQWAGLVRRHAAGLLLRSS